METKSNHLQNEGKAIQDISQILEKLDTNSRKNVVEYIFKSLGINLSDNNYTNANNSAENFDKKTEEHFLSKTQDKSKWPSDIRSLADQKKPKSFLEKIALVAFYLSECAKQNERTKEFSSKTMEKYFKQAGFPLPAKMPVILAQTTNAGYIDNITRGKYKLNPVGFNLIYHQLPKTSNSNSNFNKYAKTKKKKKVKKKRKRRA